MSAHVSFELEYKDGYGWICKAFIQDLLVEDVSEQEICIAKYNSHDPVAAFSRAREHMKATINRLQLEVSK